MIESIVKKAVDRLVRISWGWAIFRRLLIPVCHYARQARVAYETPVPEKIEKLIEPLVVRHGPFRGMKYGKREACGSAFYPKIFGSYEDELHGVIEEICEASYDQVVDIGCAEGYYAVGLAMRMPQVEVHAYDLDPEARQNCLMMAKLNGVTERVEVGGFCDSERLEQLVKGKRSLIVCDCEGYESELFAEDVEPFWKGQDLLIEVHDFLNPDLSSTLRKRFESTHEIRVLESKDDLRKARDSRLKDLEGLPIAVKKLLLGEGRPSVMEWFWIKPRGVRNKAS